MRLLQYSCQTEKLHPILRKTFREKQTSKEAESFKDKKSSLYGLKFICWIFLDMMGFKRYNAMGILGYETFLFEEKYVGKILKKRRKSLLDIGSGSWTITEKFEKYVDHISCLEPSESFQRILEKKEYTLCSQDDKKEYEVITIFNVLDVCADPDDIVNYALDHMTSGSILIVSLPFPIRTQSWEISDIQKTNHLSQKKSLSFEEAVSQFYIDFLSKKRLQIDLFTRLPYIVSLPENKRTTIYDNGLFVCRMK